MTESFFSLAILHAKRSPRRQLALSSMILDLGLGLHKPQWFRVFDEEATGPWNHWQHELHPRVWAWALSSALATHHIFMTDDLHIAPTFWRTLKAMVSAHPSAILGLLSNHPAGPELARRGARWYRCNSWIVGPCYVVPREHLERFLPWYEAWLPTVDRTQYGDDSALNEWNSRSGPGESWHPLPTIVEHRGDVESTWQSGDKFSRERLSWRAERACVDTGRALLWTSRDRPHDLEAMTSVDYWAGSGPMLRVAGANEREADAWHEETPQ